MIDQTFGKYLLAKPQPSDHSECHHQYPLLPTRVMHAQIAEDQLLGPPQVEVHNFDIAMSFREAKPVGALYIVAGFFVVACLPGKSQIGVVPIVLGEAQHC